MGTWWQSSGKRKHPWLRRLRDTHQVRLSIMGPCCVINICLRLNIFFSMLTHCGCHHGCMEASRHWRGMQGLWSTCQAWLVGRCKPQLQETAVSAWSPERLLKFGVLISDMPMYVPTRLHLFFHLHLI